MYQHITRDKEIDWMKDIELIKALEQVNAEYLDLKNEETPEYVLGRRIFHLLENFPFHLVRWIKQYRKNEIIREKSESVSTYVKKEDLYYASPEEVPGAKGVVYACITSGYDDPYEPIYKSESLDYILYTDKNIPPKATKWAYHGLGNIRVETKSNRINRYYKFHPFEFFDKNYDFSIYIDGNVQTVSDIAPLYRVAKESVLGIAMHRHATRMCIYKDAQWCEYNKRGNIGKLKEQVYKYRNMGFPENFGLCEATIIVVDMHNPKAKEILDMWWEEFCNSQSGRDQISFPFVLWKNGYSMKDIGYLGNDEYHNPKFRINAHKGKTF